MQGGENRSKYPLQASVSVSFACKWAIRAAARAAESPGGTNLPHRPPSSASAQAGTSLATTGRPAASASISTVPRPSSRVVEKTNTSLWPSRLGTSRREPRKVTTAVKFNYACAELNLTAVVTFLGSRRDVPSLLGQSDVFVFSTTREEGLGTVLIEALAAGLPVVASDVPACAEALEGGRWGRLVPPGDSAALAAALIAHLQAKETETDACSGYLERFSPPCMIASYVAATS